jgi:hypothetical protein
MTFVSLSAQPGDGDATFQIAQPWLFEIHRWQFTTTLRI